MAYTKQVIVMRKDLNMRTGKMIAQGAHASMGALLSQGKITEDSFSGSDVMMISLDNPALREWLENSFTKICVYVNSEQELLEVYNNAKQAGLISCLITDNGTTEFKGVPTLTAAAIGPAYSEQLDPITGHLKLL